MEILWEVQIKYPKWPKIWQNEFTLHGYLLLKWILVIDILLHTKPLRLNDYQNLEWGPLALGFNVTSQVRTNGLLLFMPG
jgi:hypothetical protein